jgi:glycosyltransferase involved in cell wall biosynthesis
MKVGINGWRIQGHRTGVGRYTLNVTRHWTPELCAERQVDVTFYTPQRLDRSQIPFPENIKERLLTPNWPMLVWENLRLSPTAGDDVVYHPSFSIPIFRRGKSVVAIYDAAHEVFPQLFPPSVRLFYRHLYRWIARTADLVISASEAGASDLVRKMGVPRSKIRVIYMAAEEFFRQEPTDTALTAVQNKYLGSNIPYFLFVGKLSGRRSMPLLLEGFAEFKRRTHLPHKLVIVGLNIHNIGLSQMLRDLGIEEEVIYPGFVSDEELNTLYHGAIGLISPSIYETVCLPVMEAQAAGKVVICNNNAGMMEVTGGHGIFFQEPTVPFVAEALIKLASDDELRKRLATEAKAFARQFTWQKTARETMDVLLEAASR